MAMYHAEPNRSEPDDGGWWSVETPSVFREYYLPRGLIKHMSPEHQRQHAELEDLAERHRTTIHWSRYQRG